MDVGGLLCFRQQPVGLVHVLQHLQPLFRADAVLAQIAHDLHHPGKTALRSQHRTALYPARLLPPQQGQHAPGHGLGTVHHRVGPLQPLQL